MIDPHELPALADEVAADAHHVPLVRALWNHWDRVQALFALGYTYKRVAEVLTAAGCTTRHGGPVTAGYLGSAVSRLRNAAGEAALGAGRGKGKPDGRPVAAAQQSESPGAGEQRPNPFSRPPSILDKIRRIQGEGPKR